MARSEMDASKPNIITMPADDEMNVAFEAYALALGKVAYAWNFLHERLATLFQTVMEAHGETAKAVWYSTDSDRTKQLMFKAAVAASSSDRWNSKTPKASEDLTWLIDQILKLGDARNNAVHAPAMIIIDGKAVRMAASYVSPHARAKNLRDKDVLVEFDWFEAWAEELSRFSERVGTAISFPEKYAWPMRPKKPDRRSRTDLNKPRDPGL